MSGRNVLRYSACLTVLAGALTASAGAAGNYPFTLKLDAQAEMATSKVVSTVNVHVEGVMEENQRKRVADALKYTGYGKFVTALRTLPAIGTIELDGREVEIRYVTEQQEGTVRRLLLVADRPLFFIGNGGMKPRAGYELTVVELRFDAQNTVSGTMAGAARVKPSPDGVVLDNYAESPVRLSAHVTTP